MGAVVLLLDLKLFSNDLLAAFLRPLFVILTRGSRHVFKSQGISMNAILPSFTPTALTPQALHNMIPEQYTTHMKTIIDAYDIFINNPSFSGEILELVIELYMMKKLIGVLIW